MSRSTEKKAVFFDADGTLCDMEKGVPASTKEALKKLRKTVMKPGFVQEEAELLYPGIWKNFPLQE